MRWPAHPVRTAAEHPDCSEASGLRRPLGTRHVLLRCDSPDRGARPGRDGPEVDERRIVAPMILGMSTETFTLLHVAISLIAIACGVVVTIGLWRAQRLPGWSAVFLVTTIATSVTGFFFHSKSFGAPHVVGVISLVILALALVALYGYRLAGAWRWIYVAGALAAFYLNVFVAVVPAFPKVTLFKTLARSEEHTSELQTQSQIACPLSL